MERKITKFLCLSSGGVEEWRSLTSRLSVKNDILAKDNKEWGMTEVGMFEIQIPTEDEEEFKQWLADNAYPHDNPNITATKAWMLAQTGYEHVVMPESSTPINDVRLPIYLTLKRDFILGAD